MYSTASRVSPQPAEPFGKPVRRDGEREDAEGCTAHEQGARWLPQQDGEPQVGLERTESPRPRDESGDGHERRELPQRGGDDEWGGCKEVHPPQFFPGEEVGEEGRRQPEEEPYGQRCRHPGQRGQGDGCGQWVELWQVVRGWCAPHSRHRGVRADSVQEVARGGEGVQEVGNGAWARRHHAGEETGRDANEERDDESRSARRRSYFRQRRGIRHPAPVRSAGCGDVSTGGLRVWRAIDVRVLQVEDLGARCRVPRASAACETHAAPIAQDAYCQWVKRPSPHGDARMQHGGDP